MLISFRDNKVDALRYPNFPLSSHSFELRKRLSCELFLNPLNVCYLITTSWQGIYASSSLRRGILMLTLSTAKMISAALRQAMVP